MVVALCVNNAALDASPNCLMDGALLCRGSLLFHPGGLLSVPRLGVAYSFPTSSRMLWFPSFLAARGGPNDTFTSGRSSFKQRANDIV